MTDATMVPAPPVQDWMTPDEFTEWFERLKAIDPRFTQAELSRRLDVPPATISRWLSGKRVIEHGTVLRRALRDLASELTTEKRPRRRARPTPGGREER